MNTEPKLEESALSQDLSSGGHTVNITIMRLEGDEEWTLEVVDEYGNSTVWDDTFKSDTAALTEAKKAILEEGITTFIGSEDSKGDGQGWQ
ncbi:TPA: hypothetical protein ACWM1T_001776 [Legionella pneumophila]|nr:hypothetical protein [Legionella pneumophila]